jgi:hypothetical protein
MRDYSKLNYSDLQISEAIDRVVVGKNADRNRIILRLALLHGFTYEQIDEWLRLNDSLPKRYKIQVKQIGRVVRSGELKVYQRLHKEYDP